MGLFEGRVVPLTGAGRASAAPWLAREAARELAAYNIRVIAVCPGVIETEMAAVLRQDPAMVALWLDDVPLHRLGTPADVVGGALPLLPEAAYLTGQAFNVDGGKVMS
jgi:3-oxoacyl-[acyl-carrier protein] reductase